MTAQIKVKVQRKAIVKFKVLPTFPADVVANPGLIIARSGTTYTFSLDPAALPGVVGLVIGTNVQAQDSDLQALANNSTNGLWAHTGTGTGAARTITGPATGIRVTNGDGVAGNPTLALANDLAALEGLGSTGIATRTAADTWAQVTLGAPAAGLTITNPAGIAGNPTFALANDLAAIEGLGSTGIPARTAADTWAQRAITGTASRLTVTNGDGVAGNPTLDLSTSYVGQATITTLGTITTGTWTGTRVAFANIAQGTARSVLGVTGNATADLASIQGAAGQILGVPNAGTSLAFTATPQLGLSGTLGSITFGNATSGTITLQPVTGALGTPTLLLPAAADTLVGKATTDVLTNKSISGATNTLSAIQLTAFATQAAWTFVVNNTSGAAAPTAVDIGSLTSKASPAATDLIILSDQAASGALKKATVSSVASAGSVSSIAGNTGAFTLSNGITNSTNDIRLAMPYFTANLSAASAGVTTATPTKILFNTETSDSNSWYDNVTNFRFTPLLAGKYLVTVQVEGDGSTSVSAVYAYIYKNGAQFAYNPVNQATGVLFGTASVSALIPMNGTTDFLEGWGRINGTGTLTFNGQTAPIVTFFQAIFISP